MQFLNDLPTAQMKPTLPTIFSTIPAFQIFSYRTAPPLTMPNLKHPGTCYRSCKWPNVCMASKPPRQGEKKTPPKIAGIKAGHRRINGKNGKMSLMFPALFIQIHYTNRTECITFAKFSIQMTSRFIYIAMQACLCIKTTGAPVAPCFPRCS